MTVPNPYPGGLIEHTEVIRPAAVLPVRAATEVLKHLRAADVSKNGVWNATASVWQRYDQPWNGAGGSRGDADLVGSIAVMYDTPARHEVTIYRVTLTPFGQQQEWTVNRLCDDALSVAGLTLAECPVAELPNAPTRDPFKVQR